MKSKLLLVYCTFPDEETAHKICERLVDESLAACANIFPPMKSIYRWKGALMKESECAVILKTTVFKKAALKERILAAHPYDVPAVVFLSIEDGNPEFLNWVYGQSL